MQDIVRSSSRSILPLIIIIIILRTIVEEPRESVGRCQVMRVPDRVADALEDPDRVGKAVLVERRFVGEANYRTQSRMRVRKATPNLEWFLARSEGPRNSCCCPRVARVHIGSRPVG